MSDIHGKRLELKQRKEKIEARREAQVSRGEWSEEQVNLFKKPLRSIENELIELDEEQRTWSEEYTNLKIRL